MSPTLHSQHRLPLHKINTLEQRTPPVPLTDLEHNIKSYLIHEQAHVVYRFLTDYTVKKKKKKEINRELNECQNASVIYAQILNHL